MRVLMICPQFRPLVGGYERAAERLSRELVRQGVAVTVITDRRDRRWARREELDGMRVRRLLCWHRPRLHIATSLLSHLVYLLVHGRQFDVWHVHQYGVHGTLAVLLGKLLRRPVALKLTNSSGQSIDAVLSQSRCSSLQKWAHRHVSACIAISAETADEARRFGIPAHRIVRIPNGTDVAEFRPEAANTKPLLRQQLGLGPGPFAVFVGRLSEEKNPAGLIAAWSLLVQRLPDAWPLCLVGDGPMRAQIEADIAARDLQQHIVVVGASQQVADWLRAADIYVLTSHNEGLSNTTIEAMASGLPCVVTAVSGMAELVQHNQAGLVVPCADPEAMAAALIRLMSDPALRQTMGHCARTAAVRGYAIDATAAAHRALYARVRQGLGQ